MELITEIKAGNRKAFDWMCVRYYAPLMAYANLFMYGNWAQDIVQDVLVNVWLNRTRLDPGQSLYSYLLKSVYNTAVNYINKYRHRCNYSSWFQEQIENNAYTMYDPDCNPVIKEIYSMDMRQNIDEAISCLPRKCQEVFRMSYIMGLSHKEISEKLGIAVSTVENHVYLALKQIRKELHKKGLTE